MEPLNKLPQRRSVVILIVGEHGVGKHQLARQLLATESHLSLKVHTTTCLPLPEDKQDRPRIDFVIFMFDLTNRQSYVSTTQFLKNLDVGYFLGKMCIVTTEASNLCEQFIDMETVKELADNYNAPKFYINLQKSGNTEHLSRQLLNLAKVAAGHQPGITSLLLNSTKVPFCLDQL